MKERFLITDASKEGIAAVLAQPDGIDKREHPVAYYSRKLTPHEVNYDVRELEALAVITAVEHFHVYLHGEPFTVITDHSALQWFFNQQKTGRLFRWSVRLSHYNYKIVHRPGKSNVVADALSRAPVILCLQPSELVELQPSISADIKGIILRNGIKVVKHRGVIRTVVPNGLKQKVLEHFHDSYGHPGINKTAKLISQYYWWRDSFQDIHNYVKSCKTCQLVKASTTKKYGPLQPITTPTQPNKIWALDRIVLGSAANKTKAKYIQLIVDHHSRFVWAFATPKNTSATIINIMTGLIAALGTGPEALITDQGTNFTSKDFNQALADIKLPSTS